jgi:hypothetical protein
MRKSNAVPVLVASVVAMVFLLLGAGLPLLAPTQQQAYPEVPDDSDSADDESRTDESALATPAEQPPLQTYAAECFRAARARNPRGRVLRLNANRLADRCSIIVETDDGSGRWLFDWRDGANGWRHQGELRWPDSWPPEAPEAGISPDNLAPERIAVMVERARALWPEADRGDWLYELIWMPAPWSRPLLFITFDDIRPGAGTYDGLTVVYDGDRELPDEEAAQADALYPMTRFELREDHNFKNPLYEATALAEAPVSLEGDSAIDPSDALARQAETCMHWLHEVNRGARVLRLAMDAGNCWLLLENAHQRDDFYLLSAQDRQTYQESASLALEPPPRANLLLDRSRLGAARLRERLAQARAAGLAVERLAIAWVAGAMLWQFDGQLGGARQQHWLDEHGAVIDPPAEFPLSALELATGFPATTPVLQPAAEAVPGG